MFLTYSDEIKKIVENQIKKQLPLNQKRGYYFGEYYENFRNFCRNYGIGEFERARYVYKKYRLAGLSKEDFFKKLKEIHCHFNGDV